MLPGSKEDEGVGKEKSLATYSRSTSFTAVNIEPGFAIRGTGPCKGRLAKDPPGVLGILDAQMVDEDPDQSGDAGSSVSSLTEKAEDCVEIVRR